MTNQVVNSNNDTATLAPSPSLFDEESILRNLETLLGSEWRESLMRLLGDNEFLRQQELSPAVADTLGILSVGDDLRVLRDITLHVGPLTVSCIPATFSWMPADDSSYELQSSCLITQKEDPWAEQSLSTSSLDMFLVAKRGRVSFARKAVNWRECRCLFIMQPSDYKWPFQATDSAAEHAQLHPLHKDTTDMPVLTVRDVDMNTVLQFLDKAGSSATTNSIRLHFGEHVSDCSICQEQFVAGDQILKLPCRHIFHGDCVKGWLQTKTTCPLCRTALSDTAKEEVERRAALQRDAEHFMYT
jgi:hypothetical protein